MDFSQSLGGLVAFAQAHTLIAIAIALGLLFFTYRRPKLFFTLLFLGLFLAGVIYMISSMAGSGLDHKRRLIQEDVKHSDSTP